MKKVFTPLVLFFICTQLHAQIVISEHFDGDALPPGWTQETVAEDGGWLMGTSHELASAIFPVKEHGNFIGANDKCFCNHYNDFLMSPVMDLSDLDEVWLMFDYSYLDFAPQDLELEISTDGGDIWTTIEHLPFSAAGYYGWWETKFYDISDYAGEDEVIIGFRYTDGGEWWSYGASLDNFKVFQPQPNDISLDSLIVENIFAKTGTGITLSGSIMNFGTNDLNSFTAVWDDGVTETEFLISGLDIEPYERYHFTHEIPYIPAAPVAYDVQLIASEPNGFTDPAPEDNEMEITLHGCSSKPNKKGVAELATGTWCSWCVRGHVYFDSMYIMHPQDFIGIAVHDYDPMEVYEYDSAMYAYQNYLSYGGGAGYPSVFADHKFYMDPIEMPYKMKPYFEETVPLAVNVYGSYNEIDAIAEIDVKATFVSTLDDIDYRFNLVLTEDSVTGAGPGWDQANAYADGYYGPMGGFELLPHPVPAALMHYDQVARYLADGWHGEEGSIAASVSDLDTFYRHYTIPISADWNSEKINVIGMVINHATGKIVNAIDIDLTSLAAEPEDTSGTDTTVVDAVMDLNDQIHISLHPNPADAYCIITLSMPESAETEMTLSDIAGHVLAKKTYGILSGTNDLHINTQLLPQGIYLVSIRAGDKIVNRQLNITH